MASLQSMRQISISNLMTKFGEFKLFGFENNIGELTILVLLKGDLNINEYPLVRIHSKCVTSEVFGSFLCDCAAQMELAMARIQSVGSGLIMYIVNQEARGNGLKAKLRIYQAMETDHLTSSQACEKLGYPVDVRSYDEAAAVLSYLGIQNLCLLTNSPAKVEALQQLGFNVRKEALIVTPNEFNWKYLLDKEVSQGHSLGLKQVLEEKNG